MPSVSKNLPALPSAGVVRQRCLHPQSKCQNHLATAVRRHGASGRRPASNRIEACCERRGATEPRIIPKRLPPGEGRAFVCPMNFGCRHCHTSTTLVSAFSARRIERREVSP